MKRRLLQGCASLLCLLGVLRSIDAYVLDGMRWPQPQTTFYVNIVGENGLWNRAFEEAMSPWSAAGFRFQIVRATYSDPCNAGDTRNGVRFHSSICGSAFGTSVLATTTTYYVGSTIVESDIVFNSNQSWDVYSGAWRNAVADFRRVAVHELGHVVGLGHEDGVPAIMSAYAGGYEDLQADDVAGVMALYYAADDFGNTRGSAYPVAPNSSTAGIINSGTDVDFFSIRVATRGRLAVRTTGTTDTVGTLYNASGTLLVSNDDGCNAGPNFCLGRIVNAGTYYVKVDGYRRTAVGPYTLVSRFAVDDYGNTRAEAKGIAANSITSGRINSRVDVDFFRIRLINPGRLVVRTRGTTNTLGVLYDAAGVKLASNDNGCGSALNFCISRNLAAGTYYVKVDGVGTSTGAYSLVSAFQ